MNTPTENDPNTTNPPEGGPTGNSPTGNSPNGGEPSEDSPNKGDANDVAPCRGAGRGSPAARRRVTPEEWRRLRAPFSREAYVVGSRATGRPAANLPLKAYSEEGHPDGTQSDRSHPEKPHSDRSHSNKSQSGDERESSGRDLNQAVVDLWLRPEAIRDRLDLVLSPGRYGYRLEPGPKAGGTFSMRCHLQVGPGRRTGIGTASSPRTAGEVALAGAAEAFGIGASGKITGPLVADRESWHRLPGPVLERLERREEPSAWTPSS